MLQRNLSIISVFFAIFMLYVVVFSLPWGKLVFGIFFLYSFCVTRLGSRDYLNYLFSAFLLAFLYSLISVTKGGEWAVIMSSAFSCVFLLSFYIFVVLFKGRSQKDIMTSLKLISYTFLFYLIFLMVLAVFFPGLLREVDLLDSNLAVAWYDLMPRVILKTMVLIGPFSFIAIYSTNRVYLVSVLFLIVAILTQEVMAVFLVVVSVLINLIISRKFFVLLLSAFTFIALLYGVADLVYEAKYDSIHEKLSQLSGFVALLSVDPLLGIGLGNSLYGVGLNIEHVRFIEIVPLDYLIKGGVLGLFFFSILYLFPVWFGYQKYRSSGRQIFLVFSICHFLLVLSGLSNPYMHSGTLAFLFPSMIFAYSYLIRRKHI